MLEVWGAHIPAILWTIAVIIFIYRYCEHRANAARARKLEILKLQQLAAAEVEWAEKQAAEELLQRQSRTRKSVVSPPFSVTSTATAIEHPSSVTTESVDPISSKDSTETVTPPSPKVTTETVKPQVIQEATELPKPQSPASSSSSSPVFSRQTSFGSNKSSNSLSFCAVCGAPTKKQCSRCKSVKYCSPKCQFQHWREGHKNECHELEKKLKSKTPQVFVASASENRDSSDNSGSPVVNIDTLRKPRTLSEESSSASPSIQSKKSDESPLTQSQPKTLETNTIKESQSQPLVERATHQNPSVISNGNLSKTLETVNANGNQAAVPPSKTLFEPVANNKNKSEPIANNKNPSKTTETVKSQPKASGTATNKNQSKTFGTVILNGDLIKPAKVSFSYEQFKQLFMWNKTKLAPCGLVNLGNSCFANAVLQCLTYTRPLTGYFLEERHSRECQREGWCFMCELEKHVSTVKESKISFAPMIVSTLRSIGHPLVNGRQEDAHEFMRSAINAMQSVCLEKEGGEKAVDQSTEETTLIQHIFGGRLVSLVKCSYCQSESKKYENMMDLAVEIQGNVETLEDALAQFTSLEWLDGDNKYNCERCKAYVKACKQLGIVEAPNILTIALKRFQSGKHGKLNKRVKFPTDLDISPYMCGKRDSPPAYQLYGVIVHIDTNNASYYGHYICYVKDLKGSWYKFDDSKVKEVSINDVMQQTAYMLLYARSKPRDAPLSTIDAKKQSSDAIDVGTSMGAAAMSNGNYISHDEAYEENVRRFYQSDSNGGLFSEISNILGK